MNSFLPNETSACDRRLSRAARDIIQSQILPIVRHYMNDHKIPIPSTAKKWSMSRVPTNFFDDAIGSILPLVINNASCPLNPALDTYRGFERAVLMSLPASIKQSPRSSMPHWFSCGMSGKVFATRYYLDLHQHRQQKNATIDGVCLADLCPALGGCHERAFQLEPHYGRGSGGVGPDAHMVKVAHLRQIPVCTIESMDASRPLCKMLMTGCFPTVLAQQLHVAVCGHFSCHGKLHQFLQRHGYSWRDEWEMHYQGSKLSWIGALILFGLVFFYASEIWDRMPSMSSAALVGTNTKRRIREGRRLFQKDKRAYPTSWCKTWFQKSNNVKSKLA